MDLRDIEIPKFKFGKMKVNQDALYDLTREDYAKLSQKPIKKRKEPYEEVFDFKTVKEFFLRSIDKFKDYPCVLEKPSHKDEYVTKTYEEYGKDVLGLGTAMIDLLGLKDEKVIIIGETQYGWYISYMAMLCGVGIAVPADKELPVNEIENIVRRSRAKAIIYSPKKKEDVEKIQELVPEVKYFIEMKSDEQIEGKHVGLDFLVNVGRKLVEEGNDNFRKIEIDPDAFKVLIFTSGTTSNSKGVMLSNRNLAENINAVSAYVKIYPSDRLFSVLPLHHCYESTIGYLLVIANGASVAICEGLRYIVQNMAEAKPTAMLTVPLLVETLYKRINEKIQKSNKDKLVDTMITISNALQKVGMDIKKKAFKEIYDNLGGNLRLIVSAAAPIDKKIGNWLEDIGITFLQGYGLTETAPISAVTPDYDTRIGSAGKMIFQGEVKIKNPNENGEGEILVKTPTLMLGYYEDEAETAKVMEEGGFFNTGDIGYIDEDNYIYVTGRSKNVIVTQNGKNIYPEEIEMLIAKNEEVKDVLVYGKEPDEKSKKDDKELIITAMILPDYDKIKEKHGDMTEDDIYKMLWKQVKEVNKQLTTYKAVKALEIKEGEFEKTSTMKIKRYKEITKTKNKK